MTWLIYEKYCLYQVELGKDYRKIRVPINPKDITEKFRAGTTVNLVSEGCSDQITFFKDVSYKELIEECERTCRHLPR